MKLSIGFDRVELLVKAAPVLQLSVIKSSCLTPNRSLTTIVSICLTSLPSLSAMVSISQTPPRPFFRDYNHVPHPLHNRQLI